MSKNYYIYSDNKIEIEYIDYFNINNFICINYTEINNTSFDSNDTIIFSNYINAKNNIKCNNKILFLNKEIVNTNLLQGYKYYLPINFMIYEKYMHTLGLNIVPPLNLDKNIGFNLLMNDKNKKIFLNNFKIDNCNLINDGNIILYSEIDELQKINNDISNKIIIKYDEKNYLEQQININNKLFLISKKYEGNIVNKIFNLDKISIEKRLITYNLQEKIRFKKKFLYIIVRKGYSSDIPYEKRQNFFNILLNLNYNCILFKIYGLQQTEFAIIYYSKEDHTITFNELLNKVEYFDNRYIGNNTTELNTDEQHNLYYCYGKMKLFSMITEFKYIFSYYLELIIFLIHNVKLISLCKFNKDKFIKILFFWSGLNNYSIDFDKIYNFINNNEDYFIQKKALLISKNINTYGGNQKTGIQLYNELMIRGYDVKIYCPTKDKLVEAIDLNDVILLEKFDELKEYIDVNFYDLIIVNKLDEYLNICKEIKVPQFFITHNSMDFVNQKLIENSTYLSKILTVNIEHISLLLENKVKCQVEKYINYQENKNYICNKTYSRNLFKKNIIFIGRLSLEKNINLLIESFIEFNKTNEYKLIIIGDGKFEIPYHNDTVVFLGKLTMDTMIFYLLNSDYLILPSFTEGLPFCIIEAMSFGIPVITSNINGCNEIVKNYDTGFTFDLYNYSEYKNVINNFNIIEEQKKHSDFIKVQIISCLNTAYSMPIETWNIMSKKCLEYINKMYNIDTSLSKNINNIENIKANLLITNNKLFEQKILENKILNVFFDINESNNIYNLILKVNNFEELYNKLFGINNESFNEDNFYIFMSKLNYIKNEMIENSIKKIYDEENNFIQINDYLLNEEKAIKDIYTIFL
jgi:glycosyltransferase involved in cell wall biosynthesis